MCVCVKLSCHQCFRVVLISHIKVYLQTVAFMYSFTILPSIFDKNKYITAHIVSKNICDLTKQNRKLSSFYMQQKATNIYLQICC